MKIRAILATIALALGLAGCFTSDKSLIGDADAVTPYAKITFGEQGSKDLTTLTRSGKAYIAKKKDGTLTIRLKPVDPDLYLVEMSGNDKNDKIARLYALLKLDKATSTATTYKAVAEKTDVGPGLRSCNDGAVCIDDLNAYLALAKAAIASGAKPDTTYALKLE
jgi:hypothetical protein